MSNNPIVLRFSNRGDAPVSLRMSALSEFLAELSGAINLIANVAFPPSRRPREQQFGELQLRLIASPKPGSLELHFVAEVTVAFNFASDGLHESNVSFLDAVSKLSDIGSFIVAIYVVVQSRWNKLEKTETNFESTQIKEGVVQRAANAEGVTAVQKALRKVRRRASELKVANILLVKREEFEVTIFDEVDRGRGVIAVDGLPTGVTFSEGHLVRLTDVLKCKYEGAEYECFGGSVNQIGSVVVVWGSQNPLPARDVQTEVRGKTIDDPDDLELLGDVPDDFESANAIIFAQVSMRVA